MIPLPWPAALLFRFPHSFLASDGVRGSIFGETFELIDRERAEMVR